MELCPLQKKHYNQNIKHKKTMKNTHGFNLLVIKSLRFLYLQKSPESVEAVDLFPLVIGEILKQDMYSHEGQLLLRAGIELDTIFFRVLTNRGIVQTDETGFGFDKNGNEVFPPARTTHDEDHLVVITQVHELTTKALEALEDRQHRIEPLCEHFKAAIRSIINGLSHEHAKILVNLSEKDRDSFVHSLGVAEYAHAQAKQHNWDTEQTHGVSNDALKHDVGKIKIKDEVLTKNGRLTDEEYEHISQHAEHGANMLTGENDTMSSEALANKYHHATETELEKLIESGELDHHTADRIRIISISDVFDALVGERSYKKGMPVEKAMKIMRDMQKKGKFNEKFLNRFHTMITGKSYHQALREDKQIKRPVFSLKRGQPFPLNLMCTPNQIQNLGINPTVARNCSVIITSAKTPTTAIAQIAEQWFPGDKKEEKIAGAKGNVPFKWLKSHKGKFVNVDLQSIKAANDERPEVMDEIAERMAA